MLCAINVYSEPNSHWWSEKEGVRESAEELTACCCKRERESRHPRKDRGRLVVLFFFQTRGTETEEDGPTPTTPPGLRRVARFSAAGCVSALP